jgi:serine protease AprX
MNCPKTNYKKTAWSAAWGGTKVGALVVACILLLTATAVAGNGNGKVAKDLDETKLGSQQVDVIVQYKTTPASKHFDKANKHGAKLKNQFAAIKAAHYSVRADEVAKLADEDSDIAYVSPDRPVQASGYTAQFEAVNGDIAQGRGYNGAGVTVAVIDSGIGSHSDIASSRIVYKQDFTGQGTDDQYGHGTHVAGIIGGNGYKSGNGGCSSCFLTYMGIAPQVKFVSLKVLDRNGAGTDSNVIAAINRAIALKSTYNIKIINLSLGRGVYESYATDPLTQAVESAWKAGIFVVVAAGNYGRDNSNGRNGYGTITSPGNDPYVITVGAMRTFGTDVRSDDVVTSYSSKGPSFIDHVVKPDIVAAGNKVVSTLAPNASLDANYPTTLVPLTDYQDTGSTSKSTLYFRLSGTSMAAPQVAGAAALLLQRYSTLTPDQLKARLMKTAYKDLTLYSTSTDATTGITYEEQADIFTVGAGYLDTDAALNNTDSASTSVGVAKSPTVSYNSSTGQVTLVNGSSVLWGSSVIWGSSVVWGSSVIWGSNASGQSVLWGSSVIWGSSATQGFSVLWGSSVTPTSVIWGSNTSASSAMSVLTDGDQ